MTVEFKLPDIGEGLHEAELIEWTVKPGDEVAEGQELASVTTDKVTVELPAPCAGTIAELCWEPGDVITVGEVLLRIETGDADAGKSEREDTPPPDASEAAPVAKPAHPAAKVRASPAVRREAKKRGIDLATVTPSGDGGQILLRDLDGAADDLDSDATSDVFKLSGPRRAAAERMELSSRTLATTALTFEVDAGAIRAQSDGVDDLSPLAIIAKCVAQTLEKHPKFNGTIAEEDRALEIGDGVHMGIAVASEDGLVVPVIRNSQTMDAAQISGAIAMLAKKARTGSLAVEDVQGSTFTLSSTGGLERARITGAAPVINYPNVATLWVSRITDQARVRAGQLEVGPVMACTLSFDHRFLHGAEGLAFINDLEMAFQNAL